MKKWERPHPHHDPIMKNRPTTYIHLGLPKTATTCLQANLFANHSQIHFFGKFSGGGIPSGTRPILRSILHGVTRGDTGPALQKKIAKQLAYATGTQLVPVLSHEQLSRQTPEKKRRQAELLLRHFGSCQIILCVREPTSYIKSYYTQNLKSFNRGWSHLRPDWMAKMGAPPRYFDINEWMNTLWHSSGSPAHTLAYADTADIYASVFGKENVKILIFEEFVQHPDAFIRNLCNHLQIDAEEGIRLIQNKRANEGITTGYIEQIKSIEKSFIKRTLFRRSGKFIKSKLLNPGICRGEKFRPELSKEWTDAINAFGREQNRRLVNDWGVPLPMYGYEL
jgi:hypothetical protein